MNRFRLDEKENGWDESSAWYELKNWAAFKGSRGWDEGSRGWDEGSRG